jgi:hypothetical protein
MKEVKRSRYLRMNTRAYSSIVLSEIPAAHTRCCSYSPHQSVHTYPLEFMCIVSLPLHDRVTAIFWYSSTREARWLASPASLKIFMLTGTAKLCQQTNY